MFDLLQLLECLGVVGIIFLVCAIGVYLNERD